MTTVDPHLVLTQINQRLCRATGMLTRERPHCPSGEQGAADGCFSLRGRRTLSHGRAGGGSKCSNTHVAAPESERKRLKRAASQPDGTKQDRCGGGGGGGGGREDRPDCSSPARFTLTLQHETHETAIDCKNTTGQPEETKHDECGDSKRLMNHLWLDRRREILFLSISLLGHFIVSEEVT